ncbi:protein Star-like [Penaeus monodon]|uniref:protein Star-like n=1 Tax=Penaeus monodon TaxID=6687 RepID=UPI0018A7CD75|nr:protein Star-like [Penaeus monodon]XP_037778648.1 protein Star-like [Penaeus monodon]
MIRLSPRMKHTLYQRKHIVFLTILVFLVTLMTLTTPQGNGAFVTNDSDEFLISLWKERQRGVSQVNRRVNQVEELAKGPLKEDDPELLRLLKERYLAKPSDKPTNLMLDRDDARAQNYNVYRTAFHSWIRINKILKKLFSGEPPHFFVEAGALDGEFISNTLYLEQDLGWTGLLVEADPLLYAGLPGKNRKAWSSQTCLSPSDVAERLTFETYEPRDDRDVAAALLVRSTGNLAGIRSPALGQMGSKIPVEVQCFPLFSYLLALDATSVGYVSLDVEGAEAEILLHLPWDRVDVTVWNIEHRETNEGFKIHYEEPWGIRAPPVPPRSPPSGSLGGHEGGEGKERENKKGEGEDVLPPKKVVYVTQHDPASGKDPYLVRFMKEKGYRLYDYWDGDYTFIKADSEIC